MDIFSHPLMWLQSLRYLPTWSASTKDFGQLSKIAVAWETRLRVVALYAKLGWPWVPTWHQSLIFLLLVALLLGATTTNTVSEHICTSRNQWNCAGPNTLNYERLPEEGTSQPKRLGCSFFGAFLPKIVDFLRHSYCHQIQNSGKLSLQK